MERCPKHLQREKHMRQRLSWRKQAGKNIAAREGKNEFARAERPRGFEGGVRI